MRLTGEDGEFSLRWRFDLLVKREILVRLDGRMVNTSATTQFCVRIYIYIVAMHVLFEIVAARN